MKIFVTPDEAVKRFRQRNQATDLNEHTLRDLVETYPYSDQALRLTPSTDAPGDLAQHIGRWLAHCPEPLDRQAWADAGKDWDELP